MDKTNRENERKKYEIDAETACGSQYLMYASGSPITFKLKILLFKNYRRKKYVVFLCHFFIIYIII